MSDKFSIEETINFYQDFLDLMEEHNESEILKNSYCKASRTAIEALKKQTPKKPRIDELEGCIYFYCSCGNELSYTQPFCEWCGQRINWR